MTTPVKNPINQIIASAGQPTFTYTFKINQISDIVVFKLVPTTGVITQLVEGFDYTVQGVGNEGGGTITPIGSQDPTIAGDIWTLIREMKVFRENDFAPSGDFFALTVNEQLDYLTQIAQDRERDKNISLMLNPALLEKLDPLIPTLIDGRALAIQNTGPNTFKLVMSPDLTIAVPGLYQNVRTVNSNTVLTSGNNGDLIVVDTSGGNINITLPELPGVLDFRVGIAKGTADGNIAIVDPSGANTINGASFSINQATKDKIINYVGDDATDNFTGSDLSVGITAIIEDTSPQLGFFLDTNGFSINESQAPSEPSATITDIWKDTGNTLHISGVEQIEDFTNAPRIGAKRTLIFDATLFLKNGLGITLPGAADIITGAGDRADVYADAIDAFSVIYHRKEFRGETELFQDKFPKLGNRLDTNFFAIEESQGATVASASETDIWAGDGNTLHISGTEQIDNFAFPFSIGQKRTIIFDDVLLLKNGNIKLQGGEDILTEAGDRADVTVNAVDDYSVVYHRKNVTPNNDGWKYSTPVPVDAGSDILLLTALPDATTIEIFLSQVRIDTGDRAPMIRLADSGGVESSGYNGTACNFSNGNSPKIQNNNSGFLLASPLEIDQQIWDHNISLKLIHPDSNIWSLDSHVTRTNNDEQAQAIGNKTLTEPLTLVRLLIAQDNGQTGSGSFNNGAGIAYIRQR